MAQAENPTTLGGNRYGLSTERGGRRKKFAGYLKQANDFRQSYLQSRESNGDEEDKDEYNIPGAFPDVTLVRHGDEEMLLFPSYARRHHAQQRHPSEVPGALQDIRSQQGSGNAAYWRKEWQKYEDDSSVVDVDIRGWIYTPHTGSMSRKERMLMGIARHLSGVPAPSSSRASSPHSSHHARVEDRAARHEEELVEREAESIIRKGNGEASIALRGGYSEGPDRDTDQASISSSHSPDREPSPDIHRERRPHQSPHRKTNNSRQDEQNGLFGPGSLAKRASWNQPSEMSSAELSIANAHLMLRLKPFLSTPLISTALTVFFYNEDTSKSRTTITNDAGHFSIRAALDFVPTHVRVLASDKLSATEEVRITEPRGVSFISDIDDTIKHSAIGNGAKEMFRNTFIRELGDLTIEGVKEWYSKLASLGVQFHYVSNSPWQLYPVLVSYFTGAGLPKGSFHLKQYTGMLQGIFEPVAERKKGTLEKILADFPERRFLLAGDSGEADLELYTDIVLANPGRVLGVFIRDVTSTRPQGFFDSSVKGLKPQGSLSPLRGRKWDSGSISPATLAARLVGEQQRPGLPPRHRTRSAETLPSEKTGPTMGTLIDFDHEPSNSIPRSMADTGATEADRKSNPPPSRPSKPLALRSQTNYSQPSSSSLSSHSIPRKPPAPPPKPRPKSSVSEDTHPTDPSPLSQTQNISPPGSRATSLERQSYRVKVQNKVASAYNALPSWSSSTNNTSQHGPTFAQQSPTSVPSSESSIPPPVPTRRNLSAYPAAAAAYATNRLSGTWSGYSTDSTSDDPTITNGHYSPPLSKKEDLWNRRWARARDILEDKGVMLRSWKVGQDVMEDAVRLVQRVKKEDETEGARVKR